MSKPMLISLRPGERVYINGAVVQVDRKVTIELLNDAMFLLEGHVMHYDETTTPLRQLYFVVQTMLMDPLNADNTRALFKHIFNATVESFNSEAIIGGLKVVETLVDSSRPFEALRAIRSLYPLEEAVVPQGEKAKPAAAAA
jgi:flagellar biosynthesis repressor protein FlbT